MSDLISVQARQLHWQRPSSKHSSLSLSLSLASVIYEISSLSFLSLFLSLSLKTGRAIRCEQLANERGAAIEKKISKLVKRGFTIDNCTVFVRRPYRIEKLEGGKNKWSNYRKVDSLCSTGWRVTSSTIEQWTILFARDLTDLITVSCSRDWMPPDRRNYLSRKNATTIAKV